MEYATGLPLDMPLICHWNATGMPLYTGISHCHSLAALTATAPFKPARATTTKKKTRSARNVTNPYYEHTGNAQCLDTLSPEDTELSQRLLPSRPGTASRYASSFCNLSHSIPVSLLTRASGCIPHTCIHCTKYHE